MLAALALLVATAPSSPVAARYEAMRAETLAKGRALEAVLRTMIPLGPRVDECVLIAARNDQDWEGEMLGDDGARVSLKVGFDASGGIAFLVLRPRTELPADPHEKDAPVDLALPVVDRALVAFSGGPTRMWNQHVYNPDQRHAVDLVGWRDGGSYGASDGARDDDYVIWNAVVHAPAGGTVVFVENSAADHTRPQKDWEDEAHPFGNAVVIRLDERPDRFLVLGHMRRGTVRVAVGQHVDAGDVVGRVGNSGNSSEPHLHVHVQDGPVLKQGLSVPFLVDGRPVLRGVLLEPPAHRD